MQFGTETKASDFGVKSSRFKVMVYENIRGVAMGVDIGIYTPLPKISPSKLFMG